MKGSFYRRDCVCGKESSRCTCGAKYAFTIDIGTDPMTGKRRQRQRSGFSTLAAAEAAARELLYEVKNETYIDESNKLFKDFAPEWLSLYCEEREVKPGTIRVRQHEIEKLMPYFAYLRLKNIKSDQYEDAIKDLKKHYAPNTVDGIHRTGRMIFKKAIQKELIKKDPTQFVVLQKKKKTIEQLKEQDIPKYMEKEELALFLKTAAKQGLEMDFPIFLTLSYTGMRVGELVALQWDDIDFDKHTIRIIKTYYNPNNNTVQFTLGTPKTVTSARTIAVEEDVISALEILKCSQEKAKKRLGDAYADQNFVFAKLERHPGYPIFTKTVEDRMERLLKLSGLSDTLTPHSLRHTHTSLLAEAEVVIEDIMERLGHSDDDTTRLIYRHVTKEMKKKASNKFGKLMRSIS
ncbi:tyrosine-type recombinase/integrase [Pontibacillus marinus]|uniref:DNA integrase n=2 Tax=Bacillaceae TaxID=186817 RepID=A0A0A5GDK2_9BACI|nr:DNA integrase [Pontibacillus marinus BH030004 = DSM 16465]QHE54183.1 tyrosine-type recombinase/integrase [Pontibacillus sp. HMF3514]